MENLFLFFAEQLFLEDNLQHAARFGFREGKPRPPFAFFVSCITYIHKFNCVKIIQKVTPTSLVNSAPQSPQEGYRKFEFLPLHKLCNFSPQLWQPVGGLRGPLQRFSGGFPQRASGSPRYVFVVVNGMCSRPSPKHAERVSPFGMSP